MSDENSVSPKSSSSSASSRPSRAPKAPTSAKSQADARSLEKALCAAQAAIDKQGLGPQLLDLREAKCYTDYILVVSGRGPRAARAIAENVQETMAERGYRAVGVEGVRDGRWALLDYGDVVVHVFDQPLREFYDLESMWFDAPQVALQVPPEQRLVPGAVSYGDGAGDGYGLVD